MKRLLRAVMAAAAVLGILAGAPILLWVLGRPLLPDRFPQWTEVLGALSRPDDGRLLLGFVVLIGVAAWAVLAVSIVAEIVSVVTRRPVIRFSLPGFRIGRGVAAALVATMLGMGAGPALAEPAAASPTAWTAPALPGGTAAPSMPAPEGPTYVVVPRDTLWRIAERTLGDPLRWREIYDLNAGKPQIDGGILTEASLLTVGWQLVLPADAHVAEVITVEPGDTLSELAATHLGDASRAPELYATNAGRPQPDGAALTDPDLVRPGWTLTLPNPAPPEPLPGEPAPPGDPTPPPAPPTSWPPDPAGPDGASGIVPTDGATPSTSLTPAPVPPTTSQPAPTSRPSAGTEPVGSGEAADSDADLAPFAVLGASSLVVAGLLSALAVRRRRQRRARPAHHRIAVPPDDAGRLEWIGNNTEPVVDLAVLDAALRSLTLANWDGITAPSLHSVRLDPAGTVLTLAGRASLPPPFTAIGENDDWDLAAGADVPLAPDEAGGYCAPFPTLVSVATDGNDTTLLLDLEQLGLTRLTGDPDLTAGLLRHVAAELANSRWAEDVEVLLVGFGEGLIGLNPERLAVAPDLDSALAQVRAHARSVRGNVARLDVGSLLDGRLRDVAPDAWLPLVLLATGEFTPAQHDDLAGLADELCTGDRVAVAVVVTGHGSGGTTVHIADDATLTSRTIGDGPWLAETMTEATGSGLAQILAPTSNPYPPAGPATADQPWARDMDADGCHQPIPDVVVPSPRAPDTESEADRQLRIVERQDPDLDDDLARWWAEGTPDVPLIAILGEPAVRAPGDLPSSRPSWFTEVLVYLSLHPGGVTIPKAITDLWPDGKKITTATVRHAFYGARRWAGRGLDGNPATAFVSDMQTDSTYRIRGHLLDWDLFRRLRKRAQARHGAQHPGAVGDYRAALDLVRGAVLSSLRHVGYAWLNNYDQRHDLQIPGFLVDAAHELVDIALADGDTVLARHAAEVARRVDIDAVFDRPLTDLMRIAHAENNPSEMERYAALLLDARGFDVPEELPPETFAVLNELLPSGPRRLRS